MNVASKLDEMGWRLGADLTVDPDDMRIAAAIAIVAAKGVPLALNHAMVADEAIELEPMPAHFPSARHLVETWRVSAADRYFAIYGVPFEGVPPMAGEDSETCCSPRIAIGTGSDLTKTVGMRR
jgi:hypothetical protein